MHRAALSCAALLLASCSASNIPQTSTLASREAASAVQRAISPAFGIGFAAQPYISRNKYGWSVSRCQTRGYTYSNCPQYAYGRRNGAYQVAHSSTYGSDKGSVQDSESVTLGKITFGQTATNTFASSPGYDSGDRSNFQWTDIITPQSAVLKQGTPVQFQVTLTVNPGRIQASCRPQDDTSFSFEATGTPSNGNALDVVGACVTTPTGQTAFEIETPGGVTSNQSVGVLNGYTGQGITINGTGSVQTQINCGTGLCPTGTMQEYVSGTATYTITPLTPNVSFTTLSGTAY